jgi:hypothetical protein
MYCGVLVVLERRRHAKPNRWIYIEELWIDAMGTEEMRIGENNKVGDDA